VPYFGLNWTVAGTLQHQRSALDVVTYYWSAVPPSFKLPELYGAFQHHYTTDVRAWPCVSSLGKNFKYQTTVDAS